jgi:hypothetical protein
MVRSGPLLTNRMSELLTYGSVGGGGSNPAPYPAVDARRASLFGVARGLHLVSGSPGDISP